MKIRITLPKTLLIVILILNIISINKLNKIIELQEQKQELLCDSILSFYHLSPKEGLMECLKHYHIEHPEIVYAQAILETNYFKSKLCTENNNLFGLYNSKTKEFYKFNHWSHSVEAYANMIQYKYNSPEDYYEFLKRIGYAKDPYYINKIKTIVKKNDQRRSE